MDDVPFCHFLQHKAFLVVHSNLPNATHKLLSAAANSSLHALAADPPGAAYHPSHPFWHIPSWKYNPYNVAVSEHGWWQPDCYMEALGCAAFSLVCFGSWMNFQKSAGASLSVLHFYVDFCIGALIITTLFFLGPGQHATALHELDVFRLACACIAGLFNGLANMLLSMAVRLVGISIASPITNGTAMILGITLTYLVDSRGDFYLIFGGVFVALGAVFLSTRAFVDLHTELSAAGEETSPKSPKSPKRETPQLKSDPDLAKLNSPPAHFGRQRSSSDSAVQAAKDVSHEHRGPRRNSDSSHSSRRRSSSRRESVNAYVGCDSLMLSADALGPTFYREEESPLDFDDLDEEDEHASEHCWVLSICVIGGIFSALRSPLYTHALEEGVGLSPFFGTLCLAFGTSVSGFTVLVLPYIPLVREMNPEFAKLAGGYGSVDLSDHAWGLAAGACAFLGVLSNLLSGKYLGFAASYAIGMTGPVVAITWGFFWYREFKESSVGTCLKLGAAVLMYLCALGLVIAGGK